MVALIDAVQILYPSAVLFVDFVLADDGTGPRIVQWSDRLGPQPTVEQLAAVTDQQVTAYYQQQAQTAARALLLDSGDQGTALRAIIAAAGLTVQQVIAQLPAAARVG